VKLHPVLRHPLTVVAVGVTSLSLAAGGGAVAAGLVTSHNIQDHTIRAVDIKSGVIGHDLIHDGGVRSLDIHDGAVHSADLNKALLAQIEKSTQGPVKVTSFNGSFAATNSTVTLTPDGVSAGPYADGATAGGSLKYTGLNGHKIGDVKDLVYYARYVATNSTSGDGAPYLVISLNNDANKATFSPNSQAPDPDVAEGPFHEWVATSGSWRYDNAGPDASQSFAALVAAHPNDTISGISVSTGTSAGTNLQSLTRWMEINGTTYDFGS
jgi:hypothetical protein